MASLFSVTHFHFSSDTAFLNSIYFLFSSLNLLFLILRFILGRSSFLHFLCVYFTEKCQFSSFSDFITQLFQYFSLFFIWCSLSSYFSHNLFVGPMLAAYHRYLLKKVCGQELEGSWGGQVTLWIILDPLSPALPWNIWISLL